MSNAHSDVELLSAWSDGNNVAGSALLRRHFDPLYRFFSNKAGGHEEDLIQQTFMAVMEARDAFRGTSTFRAYLFGVARLQLLTHYRKMYRRPVMDALTTSIGDLATSPSGVVSRREEARQLDFALRHLPIDQQIALELTYWEDLTASEVARVLEIPENTVYSRLRRAKQELRDVLAGSRKARPSSGG